MFVIVRFIIFLILVFSFQGICFARDDSRVRVRIITDEAEAVLKILQKREAKKKISEKDWQKLFAAEGYIRLKKRELSLNRPFDDRDFKKFVLSEELLTRRRKLSETLSKWKKIDADNSGQKALAYLPAAASIQAKIYPVIKPQTNSFVFEIKENPAIFLYLDPDVSAAKFENTLAHELHHIGYASVCVGQDSDEDHPQNIQKILKWTGAFGEGFAMLAAAGNADIHPHAASPLKEKEQWDKDIKDFNKNLKTVEAFFLELLQDELSEEEELKKARSFYGIQGPWYTVGWKMATVIEKTFGRKKLIEVMCDKKELLKTYNKAVLIYKSQTNEELAQWSEELIEAVK